MPKRYRTPSIVMDTNVLVAGACRREGSLAYEVLMGVLQEEIPLILTIAIAHEYLEVLQRERILAITNLSYEQSADIVTDLIALSREAQLHFSWRPNLRDEADNKFVEAAIHTSSHIVTYNVHDFEDVDLPRFGWDVLDPRQFVERFL